MIKIKSEKVKVESSAIITVVYSYREKSLTVEFVNNKKYKFESVDHEDFVGLKYSESIGKYFNRHIKNNYNYEII